MSLTPETGFLELGQHSYVFDGETRETWPNRYFYAFQPADEDAEHKPLALFFNGGPGFATTAGLYSFNTAAYTLDPARAQPRPLVDNPYSWASFANLLYVDASHAGFSYGLRNAVGDAPDRRDTPEHDGADFVRLLLRFLQRHPQIQHNPVLLVGESYGGTRASIMLDQLLRYPSLVDPAVRYNDSSLFEEITAHYQQLFPDYAGQTVPPERIAQQFGYQVLIEPMLAGSYQDEAESAFQPYTGCCCDGDPEQYDNYQCDEPKTHERDLSCLAAGNLVANLNSVTATEATGIEWLGPAARDQAFREVNCDPMSCQHCSRNLPLVAALGPLGPDDVYHKVKAGVGLDPPFSDTAYGAMFLANLLHVRTFVTNAAFDAVVWAPAIPAALERYDGIILSAVHDTAPRDGVSRAGWIRVQYQPAFGSVEREVRFPFYESSGHAVSGRQPGELLEDVRAWYAEAP